ncbi:hypothetical protein AMAG_03959 [Allomyces macrogynus ATCC 38327]|uniref:Dystroglycan-type cadherin-like domain-containing protein n=1 Tax=Allomyces macrogynus (strain ATCC 38327) TaxID=578462 RepID=A0A0L0S7P2_ALLM3|nr:hypothetical protein AMAG_03959 [Allomyces macrogynus ATCC 38327]|eukprot:KNE58379.1 hypothetical protein AMAG_03959 [Allomyces macrogynus ATCC 38327]
MALSRLLSTALTTILLLGATALLRSAHAAPISRTPVGPVARAPVHPIATQNVPIAWAGSNFSFAFARDSFARNENDVTNCFPVGFPSWLALNDKTRTLSGLVPSNIVQNQSLSLGIGCIVGQPMHAVFDQFTLTVAVPPSAATSASIVDPALSDDPNGAVTAPSATRTTPPLGPGNDMPLEYNAAFNYTLPAYTLPLTIINSTTVPWLTIDSTSGTVAGTVPPTVPWSLRRTGGIRITYFDAAANPATDTPTAVRLSFPPNRAPVVSGSSIPPIQAMPGQLVNWTLPTPTPITDPDSDPLTWAVSSWTIDEDLAPWLAWNSTRFTLTGRTPMSTAASMTLWVSATDPAGDTAYMAVDLVVGGWFPPRPLVPELQVTADATGTEMALTDVFALPNTTAAAAAATATAGGGQYNVTFVPTDDAAAQAATWSFDADHRLVRVVPASHASDVSGRLVVTDTASGARGAVAVAVHVNGGKSVVDEAVPDSADPADAPPTGNKLHVDTSRLGAFFRSLVAQPGLCAAIAGGGAFVVAAAVMLLVVVARRRRQRMRARCERDAMLAARAPVVIGKGEYMPSTASFEASTTLRPGVHHRFDLTSADGGEDEEGDQMSDRTVARDVTSGTQLSSFGNQPPTMLTTSASGMTLTPPDSADHLVDITLQPTDRLLAHLNEPFSHTPVPPELSLVRGHDHAIQYTAITSDPTRAWPGWLQFDPATARLFGIPRKLDASCELVIFRDEFDGVVWRPTGEVARFEVVVVATDGRNATDGGNTAPPQAPPRPPRTASTSSRGPPASVAAPPPPTRPPRDSVPTAPPRVTFRAGTGIWSWNSGATPSIQLSARSSGGELSTSSYGPGSASPTSSYGPGPTGDAVARISTASDAAATEGLLVVPRASSSSESVERLSVPRSSYAPPHHRPVSSTTRSAYGRSPLARLLSGIMGGGSGSRTSSPLTRIVLGPTGPEQEVEENGVVMALDLDTGRRVPLV